MPDLTRDISEPCPSNMCLEAFDAGELDGGASEGVEHHLQACRKCRARHEELRREQQRWLARVPDLGALQAAVADGREHRLRARAAAGIAGVAAAAACVLLVVTAREGPEAHSSQAPGAEAIESSVRAKGGPHVSFFIKRGQEVLPGFDGVTVYAGDRLRFLYSSDRPRHLAILNRDAHAVSVYYPVGPVSRSLAAGQDVALDFSVELDEYIGAERIYAVFCEDVFALDSLRQSLAANGTLVAPEACSVETLRLVKAERSR